VKQILASSKRAKRVVDLTGDDDDDREGDDGDFTKVSWLRTTRTARHLVRLENSLEIPETSAAALEMMRHEKDDHGDDGNTPSHIC
jgi:hypothetical protein